MYAGSLNTKAWNRYPRRLTYDEAVALCALGSRIIFVDVEGFYCTTDLPEVVTTAHEHGAHSFWEAKT